MNQIVVRRMWCSEKAQEKQNINVFLIVYSWRGVYVQRMDEERVLVSNFISTCTKLF